MKKILLLAMTIGLGLSTLFAQEPVKDKDQTRTQLREHFMYQDGQMYQVRNGEGMQLQSQVKLKNGVLVNPDGTFQNKKGKKMRFKNGECMDMSGRKYKNQNMYMSRMNRMNKGQRNKPAAGPKKRGGKKGGGKKGN